MKQICSHQRIIDKNQGSSKEIGYQLKGDLSHMYKFLSGEILKIYTQKKHVHAKWLKERARYPRGKS